MFYYKRGNVFTKTGWDLPSKTIFNIWLKKFSNLFGINNYNVYLTGAFCQNYFLNENLETYDIDVIIVPQKDTVINYVELKNILDEGSKIGFELNLLIDIRCYPSGYEHGGKWEKIEEFNLITITNYKKITKISPEENWEETLLGTITELIPGLYQVINDPKHNWKKFKSKNYKIPYKQLDILPTKSQQQLV